jgi:hypothetical protein
MRHGNCDATCCKPCVGNCFSLTVVKTVRYYGCGKLVSLNNPIFHVFGHSPTYERVLFRKIRGLKALLSIRVVKYICIYMGVQLKSRLQHTGMWSPAAWPPHLQGCYPVVFFLYLSLMALSCPQGIIRRAFPKCYYLSFFFTFLKLCESETA